MKELGRQYGNFYPQLVDQVIHPNTGFEDEYTDSVFKKINFFLKNHSREKYLPYQVFSFRYHYNKKDIQLVLEPAIISAQKGFEYLHTNYERGGYSVSFNNALINLTNERKNISFSFGRSLFFWGESINSSIIKSIDSGPMDFFSINLYTQKFRYEILKSQLVSTKDVKLNNYNRYFIGKRLVYKKNNFQMSIGEMFIYTGLNRGVELKYLNPFAPSFLKDMNTSDFEFEDNYNSIIFATFHFIKNNNLKIYNEFIMDDFQIDNTGRDNKLGFKIGCKFFKSNKYELIYEFTNINKTTYMHDGKFTSFFNNERPLGYKYGPNSISNDFYFNYYFNDYTSLNLISVFLKKGKTTNTSDSNYNFYGENFSDNIRNLNFFDIGITHIINNYILKISYSSFPYTNQEILGYLEASPSDGLVIDLIYFK